MKLPKLALLACLIVTLLAGCSSTSRHDSRTGWGFGSFHGSAQWGQWTYWYHGGGKMAQGNYVADHQSGRWTYWYENGQVEWLGGFDEERISGPSAFLWDNGIARAHGDFRDGLEEGLWSFTSREGKLERRGQLVRGRRSQRWTHWRADGSTLAEGYFLDGEKVGLWQFWDETGALREVGYPLPPNTQIVCDTWPSGGMRREGFVVSGAQSGRWTTWHENGEPRMAVDLDGGAPHGACLLWNERGELIASLGFERGRPSGAWYTFEGVESEYVDTPASLVPEPVRGAWSAGSVAVSRGVLGAASLWLGEVLAPLPPPTSQDADPNTSQAGPELIAFVDEPLVVPLRAQPFTKRESESVSFLRARYTDGAKSVKPPPGDRRYGQRSRNQAPQGDRERAAKIIGKPLPITKFHDEAGLPFDLGSPREHDYVCFVVMRGFAREVCIYCVTQTEALADAKDRFAAAGADVFVLYPGERNRLQAFVESIKRESGGEALPLRLLYDPDLSLAKKLGIESEFAIPTTLVLDKSGIVRYAYVGTTIDDRPAVSELLEVIEGLGKP